MSIATSEAPVRVDHDPVLVDLALQGGGAHGAFTWGVLDRLLEGTWVRIEGISGTSAGAMNAAVLVDGTSEAEQRVLDSSRALLAVVSLMPHGSARYAEVPSNAARAMDVGQLARVPRLGPGRPAFSRPMISIQVALTH